MPFLYAYRVHRLNFAQWHDACIFSKNRQISKLIGHIYIFYFDFWSHSIQREITVYNSFSSSFLPKFTLEKIDNNRVVFRLQAFEFSFLTLAVL